MSRARFTLSAAPIQAIAEAWGIGLLMLLALARLGGEPAANTLNNGILVLCSLSGLWAVARTRLPRGSLPRQAASETAVGVTLSGAMLGLLLPLQTLGLGTAWSASHWPAYIPSLLLAATGAGYLGARAMLRIWLAWDILRRQRLLWSLTHAHLVVVVSVVLLGVLFLFIIYPNTYRGMFLGANGSTDPVAIAIEALVGILPAAGVAVILLAMVLAVLLPPSALFSYFFARRTTQRLDALAATAKAVRRGDYGARVAVTGEDEVAHLQADFNAMADELAGTLADLQVQRDTVTQLLQARREMIASVSHELRTPVATVRALLESNLARRRDELAPALAHDLRVIDGEMARLEGLIDDLFLLARAEAGRLELACGPTDVAATAQRVIDALAPLAWQSGRVEVVADLPDGPAGGRLLAHAHAERLGQVLANLLRNAIRHTEPGGIVSVALRTEPDAVVLEVRDTGAGIPADELPHIWERFYRGRSDRSRAEDGAGLGLALVKELTEAMDGSVTVESTAFPGAEGRGSCFTVRLQPAQGPEGEPPDP